MSAGTSHPTRRLAIVFDGRSTSPMDLADTLEELADIVWVIDGDDPTLGPAARLLPRLGTVVDRSGLTVGGVVDALTREVGTVHGVIAFSDAQLAPAAELAGAMGLPGNSPATVERLNDKSEQRAALAAAGLPTPGFVRIPADVDVARAVDLASSLRPPLVVKPVLGDSSSDVVRVDDHGTLADALGSSRPRRHELVVEEYLGDPPDPGATIAPYVSVESLVVDGDFVPLAISGRFPLAEPFRETGDFMPHVLAPSPAAAVVAAAASAARALGVTSGALHTEIKLTADGPRIIEVNGRVAGGGINAVYSERKGVALTWLAAAVALGLAVDPPAFDIDDTDGPFTYRYFVQPPTSATRVASIGPTAHLVGRAGLTSVTVNRSAGDPVDWRAGSQEYVLRVGGTAADHAELAAVPHTVARLVDVSYG